MGKKQGGGGALTTKQKRARGGGEYPRRANPARWPFPANPRIQNKSPSREQRTTQFGAGGRATAADVPIPLRRRRVATASPVAAAQRGSALPYNLHQ